MEARTFGHFITGLGCAALVFVGGVMAAFAGALTCHEDLQSAGQAPHLCATAGRGVTLSIPAIAGPALVLVLLFASARRRTIGYVTGAVLLTEAALFTLWALISHGTIGF
jgi:hypothetical protein